MVSINPEELPYDSLKHWPPMTYRNNHAPTQEAIKDFADLLKTENHSKGPKELQPWIPFCEGRCSFCYFPVNCEKRDVSLYIEVLKKALHLYSESLYIRSTIFNEIYVGGGSPSILSEAQITDVLGYCRENFNFANECNDEVHCLHFRVDR